MRIFKTIVFYSLAVIFGILCGLGICAVNHAQASRFNIIPDPVPSTPTYYEIEEFVELIKSTPIYIEVKEAITELELEVKPKEEEVKVEVESPKVESNAVNETPSTDEVYIIVNNIPVTYKEISMLGLTIYGEANGQSMTEQAAVAWSILNRVDNADGAGYARGRSITYVVTFPGYAPGQIHGYWNTKGMKCPDYYYNLAKDVIDRWALEHSGAENVGRVLPREYTYWAGKKDSDGKWHNYFRTAYKTNEPRWDWSLSSPYEN